MKKLNCFNNLVFLLVGAYFYCIPSYAVEGEETNLPKEYIANNDYQSGKVLDFLKDLSGQQLVDSQKRTYYIWKKEVYSSQLENYFLSCVSAGKSTFINISEILKCCYGITIKEIDIIARFLNLENKQALLVYITDQETEKKSQFGINIEDIQNESDSKNIFWRADHCSDRAPVISKKNCHHWHIVSSQELLCRNRNLVIDSEENRFCYRQIRRRLENGNLDYPIYALYIVNQRGDQMGINLGYYLSRDFDCIPGRELCNIRISSNDKFLIFSTCDHRWSVEIDDLKNHKRGSIYSPIMLMDGVENIDKKYIYSDFIIINPQKSIFNGHISEEYKEFINKDSTQFPIYFTIEKSGNEEENSYPKITLFARDQLRCRDINMYITIIVNILSAENKKGSTIGICVYDIANEAEKYIPLLFPKSIEDIKKKCFDSRTLFSEKVSLDKCVHAKIYQSIYEKDLYFILGPIIKKPFNKLNDQEIELVERVFSNGYLSQLKRLVNHPELLCDACCIDPKNALFTTIYTQEFMDVLKKRNWSSGFDGDCLGAFQNFEKILRNNPFSIDLENHELVIDQREFKYPGKLKLDEK